MGAAVVTGELRVRWVEDSRACVLARLRVALVVGRVKICVFARVLLTTALLLSSLFPRHTRVSQGWRTAGRVRKRSGETRGFGAKPQRGLGRQPQDFRPVGRNFFKRRGYKGHFSTKTGNGRPKKHGKWKKKKLLLRKRATKTPRRPANSTDKLRRPNRGGAANSTFF